MTYIVLDPYTATEIAPPDPNPAAPLTSAGITLGDAQTEILAMLAGRSDMTPDRVAFWLNRAYTELATSTMHEEMKGSVGFTTEAEQPLYLLPDIVMTTMDIALVDADNPNGGVPLDKIDLGAYRRRDNLADLTERKPIVFVRQGRLIALDPVPSAVYEMVLDFRFEPSPLVLPTDTPILRPKWHEDWMMLGYKKILGANREWEAQQVVGNNLAVSLTTKEDDSKNENEGRVISSSAPRTIKELRRRVATTRGDD